MIQKYISVKPLIVLIFCIFLWSVAGVSAQSSETGKIVLYKYQKQMGVENYEIKRVGGTFALKTEFTLSFIGGDFGLKTSLNVDARTLAPSFFETKGKTSTRTTVDASVTFSKGVATIRNGATEKTSKITGRYFAALHPAPIATRMMLVRYWLRNGRPSEIPLFPGGRAKIKYLGRDTITISGKKEQLERYSVDGVMWGKEIVWIDKKQLLIALVGADAEMDRFEAVRDGYGSALTFFARRAGMDAVDQLKDLSKQIMPVYRGSYAIVGGFLVGGKDFGTIHDSVIIVRNGKLVAVGNRKSTAIPKGMKVFDATGKTILPGLFDMHAHATQAEWFPASLAAGITTMRDAANEIELIVPIRDGENEGSITVSPRLLLAGYIDSGPSSVGSMKAETPAQAKAIITTYKSQGFQQIKIYQSLKPELVEVVTKEAHRLGMTVTGHIPTGLNIYDAVDKGFDQVNHLGFAMRVMSPRVMKEGERRNFDPETDTAKAGFRFLKESGMVVEPTMARAENSMKVLGDNFVESEPGTAKAPLEFAALIRSMGMTADLSERRQRGRVVAFRFLKALHDAGIPLIVGTDLVVPGHTEYRELELFVEAGIPPLEAIKSATIVPAKAMNLDKVLGTVETGKIADLIIIDGNPLKAIGEIRNVKYVVKDGMMFDTAPLWRSVGFQP